MRPQQQTSSPANPAAESSLPLPPFGRMRRGFWAPLIVALLIALAFPLLTLWRTSAAPLHVRACLWPYAPQAGAPARAYIVIANPSDDAAVHGSWAQVHANWDMTTMAMNPAQQSIAGPPQTVNGLGAFFVPFSPTMAGAWRMQLTLSTPGRPTWQQTLYFTVSAPSSAARASPQLPDVSGIPCDKTNGATPGSSSA